MKTRFYLFVCISGVLLGLYPLHLQANTDTEKIIISLSDHWNEKMMVISGYDELKRFCSDDMERKVIFGLLDEIHYYHDQLEADLKSTTYNHSKRVIRRILKHMDKLDEKYHPDEFTEFFKEQCKMQSKVDRKAHRYNQGFSPNASYSAMVYAQEVQMYRYLKRLTKSIDKIKKDVSHFYMMRQIWES